MIEDELRPVLRGASMPLQAPNRTDAVPAEDWCEWLCPGLPCGVYCCYDKCVHALLGGTRDAIGTSMDNIESLMPTGKENVVNSIRAQAGCFAARGWKGDAVMLAGAWIQTLPAQAPLGFADCCVHGTN